jgi:hypothetical protein
MFKPVARISAKQFASAARPAIRNYASPALAKYHWDDPLNSKSCFTEEELAVSETAESYCQEQLLPRVLGLSSYSKDYVHDELRPNHVLTFEPNRCIPP